MESHWESFRKKIPNINRCKKIPSIVGGSRCREKIPRTIESHWESFLKKIPNVNRCKKIPSIVGGSRCRERTSEKPLSRWRPSSASFLIPSTPTHASLLRRLWKGKARPGRRAPAHLSARPGRLAPAHGLSARRAWTLVSGLRAQLLSQTGLPFQTGALSARRCVRD